MKSSSNHGPDAVHLASSDEQPPFNSLPERNFGKKRRKVYAQYKPLAALGGLAIPTTLHWAVQVISDNEISNDEPGYIWELAQTKLRLTIHVSSWTGARTSQKDFLGYTNLTDSEISDRAIDILNSMNTEEFGLVDSLTRLYLRPIGAAHSLVNKSPENTKAYDPLVQNCQKFAMLLKEAICLKKPESIPGQSIEPRKKKRRFIKKTGKALKVIFVGTSKGFLKLGTGVLKRALISSISNPQFIQPGAGR
ncbi:MAG: hypothetical protein M1820_000130 [Bogoriella megaspora]|nr:MAG: hypothetical protein M1820_000130 [Bogoriella megaspora]